MARSNPQIFEGLRQGVIGSGSAGAFPRNQHAGSVLLFGREATPPVLTGEAEKEVPGSSDRRLRPH